MVTGWADGAKRIVDVARQHGVGGGHGAAGSAQGGLVTVGIEDGVGVDRIVSTHFGKMVALHGTDIGLVPLADAVRELKTVPKSRLAETASFTG